jgi:hypothetical protein
MGKFEEIYGINVNDKTETKGGLKYLSWAWAWAEFKKVYPTATYEVVKFNGLPYIKEEGVGVMVYTKVTADGLTYEMWLPVMNNMNKAIMQPTMTEINKAIMRCLTKNISMFGLGLYIYAGEDLPEEDGENANAEKNDKPIRTAKGENKPSNPVKSNETVPVVKQLTREEIAQNYGIKNVQETIVWFEGKFGCEFDKWDEEMTEVARVKLQKKKDERDSEKKKISKISDADIPFPMED